MFGPATAPGDDAGSDPTDSAHWTVSPQRWGSSVHVLAVTTRRFRGRGGRRHGPGLRETAAEADQPPEPTGAAGKGQTGSPLDHFLLQLVLLQDWDFQPIHFSFFEYFTAAEIMHLKYNVFMFL